MPATKRAESLREWASTHGSDGCTGVPDLYVECCWEHDRYYRTHKDLDGMTPITRAEADRRFRRCIQSRSLFGVLSPMSWWRWLGVRLLGRAAWEK